MAKDRGALADMLGLGGGKKSDPAEPEDGARYSKGRNPVDDEAEEDPSMEPDEDTDDYDANFESFAESVGIPKGRRATAEAALKRFVMSCKDSGTPEE